MKFEDLQNQWQKEGGNASIQVSYDMLLKEVHRNQYNFDNEILWRDIQEFVASMVGSGIFLIFGIILDRWFFTAAIGMLYLAVFFIVYRRFRPKKSPTGAASLKTCIEESLDEINRQVHLLKNVFWWYLLLPGITFIFPLVKIGGFLNPEEMSADSLLIVVGVAVFMGIVFWCVCWVNRRCIRKDLLPRKQELEELLQSMDNGSGRRPVGGEVNLWMLGIISVVISLFLSTPLLFINKKSLLENMMEDINNPVTVEISPPLSPEEVAGPKELKILSARYGAKDQWVDVTEKVAAAVHQNTLTIHSGNELAGKDPLWGKVKILEIECLWDGQKKIIRVREGMDLNIPLNSDPNKVRAD